MTSTAADSFLDLAQRASSIKGEPVGEPVGEHIETLLALKESNPDAFAVVDAMLTHVNNESAAYHAAYRTQNIVLNSILEVGLKTSSNEAELFLNRVVKEISKLQTTIAAQLKESGIE